MMLSYHPMNHKVNSTQVLFSNTYLPFILKYPNLFFFWSRREKPYPFRVIPSLWIEP
jgi:hypothetical protein